MESFFATYILYFHPTLGWIILFLLGYKFWGKKSPWLVIQIVAFLLSCSFSYAYLVGLMTIKFGQGRSFNWNYHQVVHKDSSPYLFLVAVFVKFWLLKPHSTSVVWKKYCTYPWVYFFGRPTWRGNVNFMRHFFPNCGNPTRSSRSRIIKPWGWWTSKSHFKRRFRHRRRFRILRSV